MHMPCKVITLLFLAVSQGQATTCREIRQHYREEGCCGNPNKEIRALDHAVPSSFGQKMMANRLAGSIVKLLEEVKKNMSDGVFEKLVYPLAGKERISAAQYEGNDWANLTFCAIFAWCEPHGPPLCEMTYEQKYLVQHVLADALSPGGYQTVMTIANRHQVIGELEQLVTTECHDKAAQIFSALESGAYLPVNSDIWDAAAVAGVDISNCSYMALAGSRPTEKGAPWPESGADRFNATGHTAWHWGTTPGYEKRLGQFCDFSLSLYLEDPGNFQVGHAYGLRFEGHHLSINMVVTYDEQGQPTMTATPLMLGAFPMVNPPITESASGIVRGNELSDFQLNSKWVESQLTLMHVTKYLRAFFSLLPTAKLNQAKIGPSFVDQTPPLVKALPNEFQFLVLMTANLTEGHVGEALEGIPHADVAIDDLTMEAKWTLEKALSSYTSLMVPEMGEIYMHRLDHALADASGDGHITIAWAGGPLSDLFSLFGCFVHVNDLIVELYQTNEWSLNSNAAKFDMTANHVHTMIRDLRNAWSHNPLDMHMHEDHGV
mmetsp:Transcript_144507/g.402620  ORF Transcript_144507/g.402620 Transcript_144507/m.402620 type:complete len:547 (-) Transcript_144507:83-1723(-)